MLPDFLSRDVTPLPPQFLSLSTHSSSPRVNSTFCCYITCRAERRSESQRGREGELGCKPGLEASSSTAALLSPSPPLSRSIRCAKQPVKVLMENVSPLSQLQCNRAPSTEMRYKECTYSQCENCWVKYNGGLLAPASRADLFI